MAEPTKTQIRPGVIEVDESLLPPMEPYVLAAYRRMWRDPDVLAEFAPGTWVAFAGEHIVAASPDLAELHRMLDEMGEREVLLVQVDPVGFDSL